MGCSCQSRAKVFLTLRMSRSVSRRLAACYKRPPLGLRMVARDAEKRTASSASATRQEACGRGAQQRARVGTPHAFGSFQTTFCITGIARPRCFARYWRAFEGVETFFQMAARTARMGARRRAAKSGRESTAFGLPIDEQLLLVKGEDGRALRADEFAQLFAPEILSGRAKANAQLGKALYDRALKGNVRALREWQKQSMRDGRDARTRGVSGSPPLIAETLRSARHPQIGLWALSVARNYRCRVRASSRGCCRPSGGDPPNGGALVDARARLAGELADQATMENARMRGEFAPVAEVCALFSL